MQPKQRLSFLSFRTFSLSRPPPHSFTTTPHPTIPLSAEESGPSIGIEAPLKVIQKCTARCLHSPPFPPSLPTALPCPSPQTTLHPQLQPFSPALWGGEGWIHGGHSCSKSRPQRSCPGPRSLSPITPKRQRGGWHSGKGAMSGGVEEETKEGCVCCVTERLEP